MFTVHDTLHFVVAWRRLVLPISYSHQQSIVTLSAERKPNKWDMGLMYEDPHYYQPSQKLLSERWPFWEKNPNIVMELTVGQCPP